jgi:hypothetical protein
MNGSEIETAPRRPQINPLALDEPQELSDTEKMDLIAGDDSPYAKAMKKLMRWEIAKSREAAEDCDPSEKEKQVALLTVLYAQKKFFNSLMGAILFEKTSHLSDVRQKIAQEELQDREKLESIILANQT